MAATSTNVVGADSQAWSLRPRDRLSKYLRRKYAGAHATKNLARDIDVTPKTAMNILEGHWPSEANLSAIVRRFGRDVLSAVFEPDIDPAVAEMRERERQLHQELREAQERRIQAEGSAGAITDRRDAGRAPLWQLPPD